MKRISLFLATALLGAPAFSHAQDAATEERLNQLSARIEALIEAKNAQNKRIEELAKQLREVQEQQSKPNASYATLDDLKVLTAKLQEIDQKRQNDNERILKEIESLGKTLALPARKNVATASPATASGTSRSSDKVFEHVIKPGDTLEGIVRAYKEQNVKVTVEQILRENPKLKPEAMRVGDKIYIPVPQ